MTRSVISKYGGFIFPVFFFLTGILCFALPGQTDDASPESNNKTALLQTAFNLNLQNDPYWWTLLHYKKGIWGVKSLVDDPAFFLAENGRTNPRGELAALITQFFLNNPAPDKDICRFIARYTWVREKLSISDDEYPELFCDKAEVIEPSSATIVFPTYFLNNPASMFGHTFINVSIEYSNKLLSNAINYSAYTGESNGCFYTFNGVFGLFKGYYSISPYYKKLQEYSDMDQRDMWEYSLNLTEKELKRMVLHVFEMEKIHSDYFFFDENCSYNLMFLLEAARPGVNLTDRFGPWVIPIDTIKAMKDAGLIGQVHYRPSIVTDIKHRMDSSAGDDIDTAIRLAKGEGEPLEIIDSDNGDDRKTAVLELAAGLTKYRYIKKKIPRRTYSKRLMSILKARSRLGKKTREGTGKRPFRDPSQTHDAARIAIAGGVRDGHFFQEIKIRPSFTDLLSSDYNSDVGIHLQLLNAEFRYYRETDTTRLERFDLFNAVSLTPGDRFFKPFSWKVATGLRRKINDSGNEKLVAELKAGLGISRFSEITGIIYGLPQIELDIARDLDNHMDAGAGFELGMLKQWTPSFKSHFTGESLFFSSGSDFQEHRLTATLYARLSQNTALGLKGQLYRLGDDYGDEASLFFNYFF
ncbi:MAG: DUF4105 domain-containing protein [Desulfobacteraceae bacterium]|nr:DUF4105 domain-containing protein [Desulfobacteraceae bacterium]